MISSRQRQSSPLVAAPVLRRAAAVISSRLNRIPAIGLVLGSGLGYFGEQIENPVILSGAEIPGYPQPTVEGHHGRIIIGETAATTVLVVQGRTHYYEGRGLAEVTFAAQLLHRLGIKTLILTNAAGSTHADWRPGELVLVRNFINFAGIRIFPDNNDRYDQIVSPELLDLARQSAAAAGLGIHEGTYCWTTGPSFETAAEIRFIRQLGGDVVGMSTLPEAIMARKLGMDVLVISLITNLGTGISATPLSHAEVQAAADQIKQPYARYMTRLIHAIGNQRDASKRQLSAVSGVDNSNN